ncbi:ATP-binding protein [Streptomyces sp. NPDC087270]|uniref:sensor histidine kinase n=1 Tax=Streptomyces sp. NPDC087270 TaxID=3365774 RepID=UPI0037FBF39D
MSANGAIGPEREHPVPEVPHDGDRPPRTSALARFADRRPFRRKLDVLLGVPLVVIALLLGYVISGLVGQARDAGSAAQLVRSSRQVATLVDRVESEHQQALLLSVRYESATTGGRPSLTAYRDAQDAVDRQVAAVRHAFGSRLPAAEEQVLKEIDGLSSLRSTVEQSYLPADNIDPAYTSAMDDLIDGLDLDTSTNLSTTRTGSLLDSLLRAEAAHSSFETSVFSAQTGDANALIEFVHAVGDEQVYTTEAARFGRYATSKQSAELAGIEQGTAWNTISQQYAGLQVDPSSLVANGPAAIKAAFTSALQAYPQYQQQAESRLRVTSSLIGQIADRADHASDNAWWRAAWLLAGALVAFVLWLALSVAIRRSVIRPVQALTGAAAEVAEVAGRELARVADDDAVDASPPRLREMPVTARDEIGDLAAAFNRVQTTAAALLERQVLSRRNTAEMFGNVGRRVSNLTARQLSLIDAVERGETDPALLDRLYRIDHLAVRLQRNADSLMLLAGIRETGMEAGPTPLTNVVRASLGQIEGYQRVSLSAETEVTVAPDIIADLTLMLAELLENAVAFSPARSPVEVTVSARSEGALIEVTDHGLGMSAARLAEENARLVRRERLDLVPTKVLGLFVVGSLARRWGVRVTLTRTQGGGVTAQVAIPSALLLMMSPFAEPRKRLDTGNGAGAGTEGRAGRRSYEGGAAELERGDLAERGERAARGPRHAARVPESGPARPHPEPGRDTEAGGGARHAAPNRPDAPAPLPRRVPQRNAAISSAAVPSAPAAPVRRLGPGQGTAPNGNGTGNGNAIALGGAATGAHTVNGAASGPGSTGASTAPGTPAAPGTHAHGSTSPGGLRRRVKGATLATTLGAAAPAAPAAAGPAVPSPPDPHRPAADAEQVRSELDEFEAAVERAHRDTATADTGQSRTTLDTGFPEGAEE